MDTELIETKGYAFNWRVDVGGYELADKALYTCPQAPVSDSPLDRYSPNQIFFGTQLLSRRWHGELQPEAVDIEAPWLVPKQGQQYAGKAYELPDPAKGYEPLHDEPTLHRRFASLNTERLESEVLQFANRFGLLGRSVILHPRTPGVPLHGESLFRWRNEIDKMAVLLALWDWVERKQAGKLGQIIIWFEDSVVARYKWKSQKGYYQISALDDKDMDGERWESDGYGHVEEILANSWQNDWANQSFFNRYRIGDVLGPARHYLCNMLNYHLRGATPSLVPWLGYKVAFMPDSLLDALWLMFMLEVNGEIRTCWYCRGPLEPTRKDNVYCSNNCKRMAYYYNKQRKGGTQ